MENLVAVEPAFQSCIHPVPMGGAVRSAAQMHQLVCQYAPLVRRLAFQFMTRLPASVQVEDVIQNGMIGLIDAVKRFEEGMGAQFETYATQRIRGAMIDGLRENDWMPRALRRDMRRIDSAARTLEQQYCRPPAEREVADALEMSLGDYQKILRDARASQVLHLEDFGDEGEEDFLDRHLGDAQADPLHVLLQRHDGDALLAAIRALPERERTMMGLYYEEDLNLREIGEVLGVSESRVCQLHKQAVSRLRAQLLGGVKAAPARERAVAGNRESVKREPRLEHRVDQRMPLRLAASSLGRGACNQPIFQAVVG